MVFQQQHLHGHSFYVVGQGLGNYNPVTDPLNFNTSFLGFIGREGRVFTVSSLLIGTAGKMH